MYTTVKQYFHLKLDSITPKFFNDHQLWKFDVFLQNSSLLFVWPVKIFLTDFINDWSREQPLDLYTYVPVTYEFIIRAENTEVFFPGNILRFSTNIKDMIQSMNIITSIASIQFRFQIHRIVEMFYLVSQRLGSMLNSLFPLTHSLLPPWKPSSPLIPLKVNISTLYTDY